MQYSPPPPTIPSRKAIDKVEPGARLCGGGGHQPQHPRGFRALRLVFDTAALREDDFVNGLARIAKSLNFQSAFFVCLC